MTVPVVVPDLSMISREGVLSGSRPCKINLVDRAAYPATVLTYYRDQTVEVTSRAINIDGQVFPLRELGDIWHRESTKSNGSRARGREIWAIWRGNAMLLLRVSDKTRFGQIYRAIQRAFEQLPS